MGAHRAPATLHSIPEDVQPSLRSASRSRFHPHSGPTASGAHRVPFERVLPSLRRTRLLRGARTQSPGLGGLRIFRKLFYAAFCLL